MTLNTTLVLGALILSQPSEPASVEISFPVERPLYSGVSTEVTFRALDERGEVDTSFEGTLGATGLVHFKTNRPVERIGPFIEGRFSLAEGKERDERVLVPEGSVTVSLRGRTLGEASVPSWPGVLTLLPPLVAIVLALLTRQVIVALFAAIWLGSALTFGIDPFTAFLRSADTFVVGSVASEGNAYIMLFSMSLAGMVGVITATGGVRGIVEAISRFAKSSRSGQLSTWLLGLLIFFDDYANSLIVGNTMRPFADRVRISREKLSFLVDATAAPIATIGVISTWTAYQLGLIRQVKEEVPGLFGSRSEFAFFLQSIPYSFYSIFMIVFVFLVAATLRDFGPMRRAERRCRATGKVLADDAEPLVDEGLMRAAKESAIPPRWLNAVVPIVAVVVFTIIGLATLGLDDGDATYKSLLWAALGASVVAVALALPQGMGLARAVSSWVDGVRSLILAIMILVLAWSVASVCDELKTGQYVLSITRGLLSPSLIPALTFVTAGAIAFSTGTSYGTMGILVPIVLPVAYSLTEASSLEGAHSTGICLATLAAILSGAVFGDHCSPISDTTVLSSMAAGADHVDHVRTQLPYALVVGSVGVASYLLVGFGVPLLVTLPVGLASMVAVFFALARAPAASEAGDTVESRDTTQDTTL